MKSIAGELLQQRLALQRRQQPGVAHNEALHRTIRYAILDGGLPASSRLPASRDLAQQLGLSRNTVLHAYEQLRAEGYLRTLTGSGTYVADVTPESYLLSSMPAQKSSRDTAVVRLSRRGRQVVAQTLAPRVHWGAFVLGVPDVTLFPHQRFARIAARLARQQPAELFSYSHDGGHPVLREALARHLKQARGVDCNADQVLITEGVHQAIDLVARMLCDPEDVAWIEEPGYWGIRSVLAVNRLDIRAIPVDNEGLCLPPARTKPARLVFVTPSHQYPLGSVMSLGRRLALLEYASQQGAWIVEDDYDSEFRFSGSPIPALQGLAAQARVVYIGTFSKTVYPGLRLAYMVLPRSLAEFFRTAHADLYREGHLPLQATLAAFIEGGQYAAHIRRMRLIYASRRAFLIQLIHRHLGADWLHPHDSSAGLHLVLSLPESIDDVALAREAAARGVWVRPLSRYYAGPRLERGLLLGFACVRETDMIAPFETLVRCIKAAPRNSRRTSPIGRRRIESKPRIPACST